MDEHIYKVRAIADDTEWRAVARRKLMLELWRRIRRDAASYRVLDVGCGSGATMHYFEREGAAAWGVDICFTALEFCRQRGLRSLMQSRAEYLPVRSNSFDLVMSADVLEHIEDDASALADMHRVCAPGACLVVVVPALRSLWSSRDVRLQHKRRYTKSELQRKVNVAGFRVVRCSYTDVFLLLPLYTVVKLRSHTSNDRTPHIAMDVAVVPPLLNSLLLAWCAVERAWVLRCDVPLGVSVVCAAIKE